MTGIWQKVSQILFLVLFIVLIASGKMQLWLGIFALSAVLALFFGRFYCGWICPINTLMKAVTWIKRKLKIGELNMPQLLTHPAMRYGLLLLLLLTFVFIKKTGREVPVLPAMLLLGVGLTLFFPEELWHRYLCPYGAILNLTGAPAVRSLVVDARKCTGCGKCAKVCSGGAVLQAAEKKYSIDRGLCLLCLECVYKCPQKAIHYQK